MRTGQTELHLIAVFCKEAQYGSNDFYARPQSQLEKQITVVETLAPERYSEAHIPGALNIAHGSCRWPAPPCSLVIPHVLDALGKVAAQIRSQLGESLASVQKYDVPAENVTTPSLEALKAYSLGYQAMVVKSDPPAAIIWASSMPIWATMTKALPRPEKS
jgi:hypothetical protein